MLELESGAFLPESGAILLHLAEGTALLPSDALERAQVYRWLFFEQSAVLAVIALLRFRLLTERLAPDSDEAKRMMGNAQAVAATVNGYLEPRQFLVADRFSVADIALYGYLHVADEAGVDMNELSELSGWLERVRTQPGHIADLMPYPPNARPGQGRSIYDFINL